MASTSGISSGSSLIQNSGSEEDLQQQQMDQRKRKRMVSNRESARRSRMRKQKHLNDLMGQVGQMRKENNQIISHINVTTQHFVQTEDENSILRAQIAELSQRLESLNGITSLLNVEEAYSVNEFSDGLFMNNNIWNDLYVNQPIMPSVDLLQY